MVKALPATPQHMAHRPSIRSADGTIGDQRRRHRLRTVVIFVGGWLLLVALRLPAGEPVPAAAADTPPRAEASSASDSWFVSKTGGFKLQFPRGWFFSPGPAPADCTGYAPNDMYKPTPFTSFAVVARSLTAPDLPPGDQATEMLKLGQEALKASLAGYQWHDAGDLKLTAGTGKYLIYSYHSDGQALTGVVYYLILGKRQLVCHGRTTTRDLATARPIFDTLARSIQLNGEPQPAWVAENGGYRNAEFHCHLSLPKGFRPEQVGNLTIFRQAPPTAAGAADTGTAAGEPTSADVAVPAQAQLCFSQEPLPAPLQWVVYLETVKRQLRDRLLEYRPGTVKAFSYLVGESTMSATGDEREFFEYTYKLDGKPVKVGSLFWLRGRQVLVLTVSAPEADYPTAKENLFMPAAKSWTWDQDENEEKE